MTDWLHTIVGAAGRGTRLSTAYETWRRGMLAFLAKQMEDVNQFAKDWFRRPRGARRRVVTTHP